MPALKGDASIAAGTILGRYRIERLLGAGGMAEVYAARDTKLGRVVALKVLPGDDSARVERFIREAQLASSLNHPAVVTVHDSGDVRVDDRTVHYLAMELVEGEDLARWSRGRDLRKVIAVMADVADGLSRAHAGGIIHRDLKPRNIMVANGGHAKVLDFGVAKLTERAEGTSQADTAPSAAVGTTAYMSPEQIEGKDLDPRTDIFSFGCVLFEIVAGKPPFQRATPVETMHATLHDPTPSIRDARHDVLPGLERVIRKCLVKDREERYQSMKDVALDLREIARDEVSDIAPAPRRTIPTLLIGLVLAAIVIGLSVWTSIRSRRETPAPLPHPVMTRLTNQGNVLGGAMSPDGKYIVYTTQDAETQTLWVKQIATATAVKVVPSQRVTYTDVRVSPDGNYIYYALSQHSEPNVVDLMQVPLLGGTPRPIAADIDGWLTLSPDGKRAAFRRFNALERIYRLFVVDIETGVETQVLAKRFPDFIGQLAWSSDGTRITFTGGWGRGKGPVLFDFHLDSGKITSLFSPPWRGFGGMTWMPDGSGLVVTANDQLQPAQVWIVPTDGSSPRKITSDLSEYNFATVSSDSRSIAVNRVEITANVWLVPIENPATARALTTGVGNRSGMGGVRFFPNGDVLFVAPQEGVPTLQTVSRDGSEPRGLPRRITGWGPAVSPDGKHLAFVSDRGGGVELWTSDIDGTNVQQVTGVIGRKGNDGPSAIGPGSSPSWFPDSRSIAFVSNGTVQAAWKTTIGTGVLERITDAPVNMPEVSPDGKLLLCRLRSTKPGVPLWRTALVKIGSKEEPRYFDVPRFGTPPDARWFPDGKRFAFLDYAGGVANIWSQDLDGSAPKQLTNFDTGTICGYDVSGDSRFIAVSRCERANDLVLISGFR